MTKCVFLDRDGVLNEEMGTYVYEPEKIIVPHGMPESLQKLKQAGFLLVVVTNQAGIAMGKYTRQQVWQCHEKLQQACGNILDALYFSPHHPDYTTASLSRKPDSLMLEKAIARFGIDPRQSWMIGDRARDIEAGHKQGIRGILIQLPHAESISPLATYTAQTLSEATHYILQQDQKA